MSNKPIKERLNLGLSYGDKEQVKEAFVRYLAKVDIEVKHTTMQNFKL